MSAMPQTAKLRIRKLKRIATITRPIQVWPALRMPFIIAASLHHQQGLDPARPLISEVFTRHGLAQDCLAKGRRTIRMGIADRNDALAQGEALRYPPAPPRVLSSLAGLSGFAHPTLPTLCRQCYGGGSSREFR